MDKPKKEIDYVGFYESYVSDLKKQHILNQKRIRTGIKVNIFLPLMFLIISFAISSSKLVFLILWIVSLFGIAFYLMYVEYTDFKMQDRLNELGEGEFNPLIGRKVEEVTNSVTEKADMIDEHVENTKKEIAKKARHVAKKKDKLIEKIMGQGGDSDEHN